MDDFRDRDAYLDSVLISGREQREIVIVVHVHLWRDADPEIERHLRFRDRLRRSPEDRLRYETHKRELAEHDWRHMQEYADAKGALIEAIIARADD